MNTSLPLVACFSVHKSYCQFRTRRDPCSPLKPLADLFCNAASSQGSLVVNKHEIPSLGDVCDDFLLAKLWSKFSDQFIGVISQWGAWRLSGHFRLTILVQKTSQKVFVHEWLNQQIYAWGSLMLFDLCHFFSESKDQQDHLWDSCPSDFSPLFCYLKFQHHGFWTEATCRRCATVDSGKKDRRELKRVGGTLIIQKWMVDDGGCMLLR